MKKEEMFWSRFLKNLQDQQLKGMKITYEQMKRELTEIRYYYLMQGTYRERVDETQETLDLVEKYLPLIKKMPTKLKGYFIERYKNGSSISKMAEKWKVSNDFVVKVKKDFLKILLENLNKEEK